MATKDDHPPNDPKLEDERGLNRRDFVKTGVAAGLGAGAGALVKPGKAQALEPDEAQAQVLADSAGQTTIENLAYFGNEITAVTQQIEDAAQNAISRSRISIMINAAIVVIASLCISAYITLSIRRPLSSMVSFAQTVESGELSQQIDLHSEDEIGILAVAFSNVVSTMREIINKIE